MIQSHVVVFARHLFVPGNVGPLDMVC